MEKLTVDGLMELARIFGGTRWAERVEPSAKKTQERISAYRAVEDYATRLVEQAAQEAKGELSDEEIVKIIAALPNLPYGIGSRLADSIALARAILAAKKEPT